MRTRFLLAFLLVVGLIGGFVARKYNQELAEVWAVPVPEVEGEYKEPPLGRVPMARDVDGAPVVYNASRVWHDFQMDPAKAYRKYGVTPRFHVRVDKVERTDKETIAMERLTTNLNHRFLFPEDAVYWIMERKPGAGTSREISCVRGRIISFGPDGLVVRCY